jgi:predicted HAD superfamily hydrolase
MFELIRLKHWASAPSIRLVSVDLFDTLLLRGTRPELVRFHDIAARWHQSLLAQDLNSPGVEALYRCRLIEHKLAYDRIKSQDGQGEVRQEAILESIAKRLELTDAVVPVLTAAEITYETAAVTVNAGLAALLIRLRREKPVVFSSDMYLPGHALVGIMAALVPELADLPLYVSSDLGRTKRHGTLFPHLVAVSSLAPQDILHVGDNPVSDVARPRAAGLEAMLLPRSLGWRLLHGLRHKRARIRLKRIIEP